MGAQEGLQGWRAKWKDLALLWPIPGFLSPPLLGNSLTSELADPSNGWVFRGWRRGILVFSPSHLSNHTSFWELGKDAREDRGDWSKLEPGNENQNLSPGG